MKAAVGFGRKSEVIGTGKWVEEEPAEVAAWGELFDVSVVQGDGRQL